MTYKHTSAPWTVNADDGETIGIIGNAGNNARGQKYVAAVQYNEKEQEQYLPNIPSHEEARANANLFAAAPDLLEALEKLLNELNNAWDKEPELLKRLGFTEGSMNLAEKAIAKAKGEV
jgi:hypothetical protein